MYMTAARVILSRWVELLIVWGRSLYWNVWMALQGRFFHHVSERRCFQVFEFRFGSLPSASIPIERPGCIVFLTIASSVTSLRRQAPDIELVFLFRGLLAGSGTCSSLGRHSFSHGGVLLLTSVAGHSERPRK